MALGSTSISSVGSGLSHRVASSAPSVSSSWVDVEICSTQGMSFEAVGLSGIDPYDGVAPQIIHTSEYGF